MASEKEDNPLQETPRRHHESTYGTYYYITVGVCNPVLDLTRSVERTERVHRRLVPGMDARLRVERDVRASQSPPPAGILARRVRISRCLDHRSNFMPTYAVALKAHRCQ
jgi:hypothetical protein